MPAGLAIRPSKRGGRGVFATRPFRRGETIEVCPLLVAPESTWGPSTRNYVFQMGRGMLGLPLGYGSLYNHGRHPNTEYEHTSKYTFTFKATRDIMPGEEILSSYGEAWWETRDLKPN